MYLVLSIKLSEESLPIPQVIVYSVITSHIDISQNPQTTTHHVHVYSWERKDSKRQKKDIQVQLFIMQ